MSERYFDRNEAEELLPLIAGCLTEARQLKQTMDGLDHELARAAAKVMMLGGWLPPHRELSEKLSGTNDRARARGNGGARGVDAAVPTHARPARR